MKELRLEHRRARDGGGASRNEGHGQAQKEGHDEDGDDDDHQGAQTPPVLRRDGHVVHLRVEKNNHNCSQ